MLNAPIPTPNCCTSGVLMPNSAAASNASAPPRSAGRDWEDNVIQLTVNRTVSALAAGFSERGQLDLHACGCHGLARIVDAAHGVATWHYEFEVEITRGREHAAMLGLAGLVRDCQVEYRAERQFRQVSGIHRNHQPASVAWFAARSVVRATKIQLTVLLRLQLQLDQHHSRLGVPVVGPENRSQTRYGRVHQRPGVRRRSEQ